EGPRDQEDLTRRADSIGDATAHTVRLTRKLRQVGAGSGGRALARRCVRACAVADPVRPEPADGAGPGTFEVPSVLVDKPMVERADEREVLEVRRSAARPPSDVVCLREPPVAASGKRARSVAVAELPHHPRRGFTRRAADADHRTVGRLDNRLDL